MSEERARYGSRIEVDGDALCAECQKPGRCKNGLCLACNTRCLDGLPMASFVGRQAAAAARKEGLTDRWRRGMAAGDDQRMAALWRKLRALHRARKALKDEMLERSVADFVEATQDVARQIKAIERALDDAAENPDQLLMAEVDRALAVGGAEDVPAPAEDVPEPGPEPGEAGDAAEDGPDEDADAGMVAKATEVVRATGQAKVATLQRRLKIGYTRAARIMDRLEEEGVVSARKEDGSREVLP